MKRTILEVKENIKRVHGDSITLLNDILPRYKEKLALRCNKCGHTYYAIYDNVVNKGSGCPYCANHIKTNETFISELNTLFGNKLLYDKVYYINAKTPVTLICPKHGEFCKTPNKLLCGQGCPKCKLSRLESIVMNALQKQTLVFETQKRFDWLGKQSLDFYLPKYNIAIECQGEQHYHQVYFNGKCDGIEKRNLFKSIISRDKNKYTLCNKHNIKILYFIDDKITIEELTKFNDIYNNNFYYDINYLINDLNELHRKEDERVLEY